MIRGVLGAMLVGLAVWASPVAAQAPDASVGSQIRIVYGEPKNPAHRPIYERLQKRRVLEDFRDFLSPLQAAAAADDQDRRLRRGERLLQRRRGDDLLRIHRLDSPDRGEDHAVERDLARRRRGRAVRGRAAARSGACDLRPPEDSAVRPRGGRRRPACRVHPAAIRQRRRAPDHRRRGVAVPADGGRPPAGHGRLSRRCTACRRSASSTCCASPTGRNRSCSRTSCKQGFLPPHRVGHCRWEYQQILYAFKTLISPHVDPVLQEKVRGREWLRPETASEDERNQGHDHPYRHVGARRHLSQPGPRAQGGARPRSRRWRRSRC